MAREPSFQPLLSPTGTIHPVHYGMSDMHAPLKVKGKFTTRTPHDYWQPVSFYNEPIAFPISVFGGAGGDTGLGVRRANLERELWGTFSRKIEEIRRRNA